MKPPTLFKRRNRRHHISDVNGHMIPHTPNASTDISARTYGVGPHSQSPATSTCPTATKPATPPGSHVDVAPTSIKPVDINGTFGTLAGSVTSTLLDGPAVALDSGHAFSGLVEIRAASLVGDLHVSEGSRRQDAYALRVDEDCSRIQVAVCDGVGSRSRSNEGAALMATAVVRSAAHHTADPVGAARSELLSMSAAAGVPAIEFSTTLVWVEICVGKPRKPWTITVTQYGDGDLRVLQTGGIWSPTAQTPVSPESDARSFALPLASQPSRRYSYAWMPNETLVVATDGLSNHLDSGTIVGHYLADAWSSIPDRWEYLSRIAFRSEGAGDDRTAVTLWRTDSTTRYSSMPSSFPREPR